jgi:hypothetical protein
MCEKATEIQASWNKQLGDLYKQFGSIKVYGVDSYADERNAPNIWLPRQDQLQEMVGNHYSTKAKQLRMLAEFDDNGVYRTYEQLWLAFVMKEKGKVWNGEDWIEG